MSKIEVNTVEPQCGTTLTLGASGDTVTLGSGASQSGFGRTGTVDWDTTKKTASFTATSGDGYFVDTTSSALTVTLPASPSAGDIVAIADYAGTAFTNNITIARNGSNIEGGTDNATIDVNRESKTFVYVDATQGWVVVNSNDEVAIPSPFLVASGGTVTTSGNYKIHTFTGPGDFTVSSVGTTSANNIVSYMVVAGGGGGGAGGGPNAGSGASSGGGGAGGFREYKGPADCYTASPLDGNPAGTAITVTAQAYPITVGGGGTAPPGPANAAGNGSNSIFSTITSTGGGFGATRASSDGPALQNGGPGGSGGGGLRTCGPNTIGSGNTPPVTPPQGNDGGTSIGANTAGGGGGGATAAGTPISSGPTGVAGGAGGAGATTSITGSPTTYAGCGGGAGSGDAPVPHNNPGGAGGTGGGGAGGGTGVAGTAGTDNTGGGGGGGGSNPGKAGAAGGSGIVVIRYKYQ